MSPKLLARRGMDSSDSPRRCARVAAILGSNATAWASPPDSWRMMARTSSTGTSWSWARSAMFSSRDRRRNRDDLLDDLDPLGLWLYSLRTARTLSVGGSP